MRIELWAVELLLRSLRLLAASRELNCDEDDDRMAARSIHSHTFSDMPDVYLVLDLACVMSRAFPVFMSGINYAILRSAKRPRPQR